ncbi:MULTISPECIES: phage tail assembly protein T [unclassified Serratia (in: enterobacteria)]|uniref:phage tail assembly protein T n=1 Tax=unclassified Serratia (in: enterobacteria) TaxID=2647522 RepID=UPI00307614DD
MKLALRLGKTLGELRQTMSVSELRLWMEFNKISPIGDERSDYHAAQISAAAFNSQRTKDPISIPDMLLRWSGPEEEDTEDTSELEGFLGALAD